MNMNVQIFLFFEIGKKYSFRHATVMRPPPTLSYIFVIIATFMTTGRVRKEGIGKNESLPKNL